MASRPPKKSETIEVRLSHEAKIAFAERCRRERRTVSEAVRFFIESAIEQRPLVHRSRRPSWRMLAAVAAGAVLGMGAAAPSFARVTETSRAAFDQLDRDHDGMLSFQEFRSR